MNNPVISCQYLALMKADHRRAIGADRHDGEVRRYELKAGAYVLPAHICDGHAEFLKLIEKRRK